MSLGSSEDSDDSALLDPIWAPVVPSLRLGGTGVGVMFGSHTLPEEVRLEPKRADDLGEQHAADDLAFYGVFCGVPGTGNRVPVSVSLTSL